MLDEREVTLVQIATLLVEEITLPVERVMVLTGYDRNLAYAFMEDLVQVGAATWTSPVLGIVERNLFFTERG